MDLDFVDATEADLPEIVAMQDDDFLSGGREDTWEPLSPAYLDTLNTIQIMLNMRLIVAKHYGEIVGMLQIIFLQQFYYQGGKMCELESVRISGKHRGKGLGHKLLGWCIEQAKAEGCRGVQLTSNDKRTDAIRFYKSLGFKDTHAGMKYSIEL